MQKPDKNCASENREKCLYFTLKPKVKFFQKKSKIPLTTFAFCVIIAHALLRKSTEKSVASVSKTRKGP